MLCYECGGIGHKRSDHKKKKIEKIDVVIETEREEIVEEREKRDIEIATEEEKIVKDKR